MEELKAKSKALAYYLRHNPFVIDLSLDAEGWASIDDIVKKTIITRADIEKIVKTDSKKRYSISNDGRLIRANQGHSVVQVDIKFTKTSVDHDLYHGTKLDALSSIFSQGLLPMSRQYVHLSADVKTAKNVATRGDGICAILTIRAASLSKLGLLYMSENGIYLAKTVPPHYIKWDNVEVFE